MTTSAFNNIATRQMLHSISLLGRKGNEYAPNTDDRLGAFKKAAALQHTTPKAALFGMLAKHLVSLSDMCTDEKREPTEKWEEKITDSINYLLLLRAVVEEENGQN